MPNASQRLTGNGNMLDLNSKIYTWNVTATTRQNTIIGNIAVSYSRGPERC